MTGNGRLDGEPSYAPCSMDGDAAEEGSSTSRWKAALENDFAARLLWSVTGTYSGANHQPVTVLNGDASKQVLQVSASATVQIPSDAGSTTIHIILTIKDNGSPSLYSYCRLIVNVK